MKKILKEHLPHLFADEEPNTHYIRNQHIIMRYLNEIIVNLKKVMERLELEWSGQEVPTTPIQTNSKKSSILSWGVKKMKEYLKKLGRTKFQALLASLILNGVSAYLFLSGTLDIDGVLNSWMPIINLTVGTISTWVYIIVEGSIDKANVGGSDSEKFTTNTEHME